MRGRSLQTHLTHKNHNWSKVTEQEQEEQCPTGKEVEKELKKIKNQKILRRGRN